MKSHWFSVITVVSLAGCDTGSVNSVSSRDAGGTVDGAPQNTVFFRPTIQADLASAGCLSAGCHSGGDVPMQLITPPNSDSDWQANYDEVKNHTGNLIAKATGAGSHSAPLSAGDPELERWQAWIAAGAPFEETAGPADAGPLSPDASVGPQPDAGEGALSWTSPIAQIMITDGCTSCHGLHGAYSLESYAGALGFGTDQTVPNVVPGNAASLLITYYDDQHYTTSTANAELIRRWIVDENAAE